MHLKIRRAAVLGAGVMGAQIAALLAAAGVRTHLLDLAAAEPPTDKAQAKAIGKHFRSARAVLAIENLKQLKPAPLYTAASLANIIPGNFDDDMPVLAECDWVIEAVVERLDIKQSIHKRIAEYVRPHVPVTTNTSGISLETIAASFPEEYQSRFFGTHFFNPPRYMKLLEVIAHPRTDRALFDALNTWTTERLGKGIVEARDTVNFIANRIGIFGTQSAFKHMAGQKLNIETVDALSGPLIGRAKSATFRTTDVVGLDTAMAVAKNTFTLAKNDPYKDVYATPVWVEELIKNGSLGQKTNSVGLYKKDKTPKGETVILAYRPETKTYAEQQVQSFPWDADAAKERDTVKRLRLILSHSDAGAQFVWNLTRDVFSYAASLTAEITGGAVKPIDDALRWGFDDILARLQKDGAPLPAWAKPGVKFYDLTPGTPAWTASGGATAQLNVTTGKLEPVARPSWSFSLPKFENRDDPRLVLSNKSASLVDLGDGVACLSFHSKMNSIDNDITDMMMKSIAKVNQNFDALVIANDADAFSAGANLKMIVEAIHAEKWDDIEKLLRTFQGAMQMVKFAPFPTVTCPHGLTLGGGCEVALHGAVRIAAGETYAGLVEAGVGLIPAGGGTKELALRAYELMSLAERGDPSPFLQRAFMLIGMGRTSSSGYEAVEMGLFPAATTHVSLASEQVTARAKRTALAMVKDGYVPKLPATGVKVWGDPGIQTFKMMLYNMVEGRQISPYDAVVGEKVATVLCGGAVDPGTAVDEQYFLDLERRVFIELCKQPKTRERIEHMLKTGKPLRN